MKKLFILLFGFLVMANSIYDIPLKGIEGGQINLNNYRGKKILIVNTASNSPYVTQYAGLELLYQKYKDSLIIIAVPSNSFGAEPGSNPAIKELISGRYQTHFIITERSEVAGESQSPLFVWLTHKDQNTVMSNIVADNFYKFLIDGAGNLVGAFAPSVDPMSEVMQKAILSQ